MQIDIARLSPQDAYKLLTNIVVPRPIAWVTSHDSLGRLNLAPFSFFNAVGSNPPLVIISVGDENGAPKHTAANIAATGQFVVNLITEDLLDAMNISAADFPAGTSELDAAGLATSPSLEVSVPRVAKSQASLECQLHSLQRIGSNNLILGQVVAYHVADELMGPNYHINGFSPIGRLGSPSAYCRTADRFELPRVNYAYLQSGQPLPAPRQIK